VTVAQADAAVRVIDARSAGQEVLPEDVIHAADVVPLRGNPSVSPDDEIALTAAAYEALALLILLITCTNVSALVVGTAVARRHEIAVRLSLGASRARLIRQLLTESSLLALAGGALGLLVYWWIARLLVLRLPEQDIVPDLTTAALTMCVALGTGILFGLSPALHATRRGTADALKDSAAGATARSRLQRALVVTQIALTQPLLVGLGVTMAIVLRDSARPANADVSERTIRVSFNLVGRNQFRGGQLSDILRSDAYKTQAARVDAALRRVAALPGVVGIVRGPVGHSTMDLTVVSEDRGATPPPATRVAVRVEETPGPDYFALLEIAIVRGRALAGPAVIGA
jgi:hypothetical protein